MYSAAFRAAIGQMLHFAVSANTIDRVKQHQSLRINTQLKTVY